MSWWINALIGVLAVALAVLVAVRLRIKRRLDSIDGMVGVTTRGAYSGKVIGGEFTKIYKRKEKDQAAKP